MSGLSSRNLERKIFINRLIVMTGFVLILAGVLVWRMVNLQIVNFEKYSTKSENNRIKTKILAPSRGLIYDRNGKLLAQNIPSIDLKLNIEKIKNLDETIEKIAELIELSEYDLKMFQRARKSTSKKFEPIVLKRSLTQAEVAIITTNSYFLPGVLVDATLVRNYPFGEYFTHALGYVAKISSVEKEKISKDPVLKARYRTTNSIGKGGVEKQYESILLGEPGFQQVESNVVGRTVRVLEETPPTSGKNIHLFLDAELQALASKELVDFKYPGFEDVDTETRAGLVAIEVETGGILAMVSTPTYDPNLFVTGISHKEFNKLNGSVNNPFYDRASRSKYAPASTVKPLLGIGATEAGVTNWGYIYDSNGSFKLPDGKISFTDHKQGGHGDTDLEKAVIESVNTYFFELAYNLKLEKVHEIYSSFGYGQTTAVDVYNAKQGLNPDRAWKKRVKGRSWYAGDTVNLGIGQGFMLVTPLQAAIATTVMARNGKWFAPRVLNFTSSNGEVEKFDPPQSKADIKINNPRNWELMNVAMQKVVHSKKGTAQSMLGNDLNYRIAAKTGTAQVVSIKDGEEYDKKEQELRHENHAWFIGYAPADDPKIALAMVIENGNHGGVSAAPIARKIFDAYLNQSTIEDQIEEEQAK